MQKQAVPPAFTGIMRNAQAGLLPLFAWTLGMPASGFRRMAKRWFPDWSDYSDLPDAWFDTQLEYTPKAFFQLVGLLISHRGQDSDSQEAMWVARAVAAACFGCRPLWQDLGLADEAELARLLQTYFPRLAARNPTAAHCKRFLFQELAQVLGKASVRPLACTRCRSVEECFA